MLDKAILPEIVIIGVPGSILFLALVRYVLNSAVIIAYIEKRKACHLSDNEVRIAKLKARSKRPLRKTGREIQTGTDPLNSAAR